MALGLTIIAFGLIACALAPAAQAAPGDLTQLPGAATCVTSAGTGGACEDGLIGQLGDIAVAPDGLNAYAASAFVPAGLLALARNPISGELNQLPVPAACYGPVDPVDQECTEVPGTGRGRAVAVSPDGRHVYVGGDDDGYVAGYVREADGSLSRVSGQGGCVSAEGSGGECTTAPRLPSGIAAMVVSPDGRHVYAAGNDAANANAGVTVLIRDASTGALSLPAGDAACITEFGGSECEDGHGVSDPQSIVVSADGSSVYVGAKPGPSAVLAILTRDPASGRLTQSPLGDGCYSQEGSFYCFTVDGFAAGDSGFDIAISPDGAFVYALKAEAGGDGASVLRTFTRASSGALTPLSTPGACLHDDSATSPPANCDSVAWLQQSSELAITADALFYASADDESGAAVAGSLRRDPVAGTLTALPAPRGCVANGGVLGCRTAAFNFSASSLEMSPNGRNLYLTSFGATTATEPGILTAAVEPAPVGGGTEPARCAGRAATIEGTAGRNVLRGTPGADVIAALAGNDVVRGAGGNDIVCAGRGRDGVRGGAGRDSLRGQAGNDKLQGERGNDRLNGGPGRDRIKGGPGRDRLKGGGGRDRCNGGGGKDRAGSCERRAAV